MVDKNWVRVFKVLAPVPVAFIAQQLLMYEPSAEGVYMELGPRAPATPYPRTEISIPAGKGLNQQPAAPALNVADWTDSDIRFNPDLPKLIVAWATWCPGCVGETAYLSALHDKYAGKLDVVGLSDEPKLKIYEFDIHLITASAGRAFPVATDVDRDEGTLKALSKAVGRESVVFPYGWLIHRGYIAWHGNPGDAVAALDEVLATGDAKQARELPDRLAELKQEYQTAYKASGRAGAAKAADELLEAAKGLPGSANSLAWDMLEEEGSDPVLALRLATSAKEASFGANPHILDTYALAKWKTGNKRGALVSQTEAIRLCDALKASCGDERRRLKQYRQAGR